MTLGDGIRRNIAHVDPAERAMLRDAFLELNRRFFPGTRTDSPAPGGVTWWFKQDEIHQATHVHGGPEFIPWHREIVNRLEEMLRQINPQLSLHYWDWTQDPRAIPNANLGGGRTGNLNLFTPDFMGYGGIFSLSIGTPWQNAIGPWRSDGFYLPGASPERDRSGNPADPPAVVSRFIPAFGVWASADDDRDILRQADYAAMRGRLERVHNNMHGFVNMGDQHISFRDPFVFLLHSNVDRLFALWQTAPEHPERLHPEPVYGTETNLNVPVGGVFQNVNHSVEPWSTGHSVSFGNPHVTRPWAEPESLGEPKTYKHPSIVLPPAYDVLMGRAGRWGHADLTAATGAPSAAAWSPIGYGWESGASKQVVYLTRDWHIHELSASFAWSHADLITDVLPNLPSPAVGSRIAAYSWETNHSKQVVYVTNDGHIHELSVRVGGGWNHLDLMTRPALADAPSAALGFQIAAYGWEAGQTKQVVYVTTDGHIHELSFPVGGDWSHVDLTALTGAPSAEDSQLAACSWEADRSKLVVYATQDGHIHELSAAVGGGWSHADLMTLPTLADAPRAAGSPVAYSWETGQSKQVVYETASGHIHELSVAVRGNWSHADLTVRAGAPPNAPGSPIAAFGWRPGASKQVAYVTDDGHIHELSVRVGGDWSHADLTARTPGTPNAARRRPIVGYSWEKRWSKQVVFLTEDGHLHELFVQA